MALQRTHRAYEHEHHGPVRLGPQDLRDLAAIFASVEAAVERPVPGVATAFYLPEHEAESIEDVLGCEDADTLASIHIVGPGLRLSFHAAASGTMITRSAAARTAAEQEAIDEAAGRLREIIRARELHGLQALRQRGPGKWLLAVLFALPAAALVGGPWLLGRWLTNGLSQALSANVVWLSVLVLLFFTTGPKYLIRLRGQAQPWYERRQGLVALLGLVVAVLTVLIPLVT